MATLNLATTEVWTDKAGQRQEKTGVASDCRLGQTRRVARRYLKKGKQLYVEGRLQTRLGRQGRHEALQTEIRSDRIVLLGGGGGNAVLASGPVPTSATSRSRNSRRCWMTTSRSEPCVYVANGKMEGGKLHVFNRREMAEALLHWKDCHVTITVEKQHATRSKPQNDYYWSVVVQRIRVSPARWARGLTVHRGSADDDMTHECLKAQFMDPELVRTGVLRGWISEDG